MAKEDIRVYKVLKFNDFNEEKITSPIYDYETWHIGVTNTITKRAKIYRHGQIEDGYFHSFKNFCDAINRCVFSVRKGVFEAIIPKGTWYYEGLNPDGTPGYASKSLKIVSMIQKI